MRKSLGFPSSSQDDVENPKMGHDSPQVVQALSWEPVSLPPPLGAPPTPDVLSVL